MTQDSAGRAEKCFMYKFNRGASLGAQIIKNPPAMQETWVQSLSWEDPLEKEYSCIPTWRIPWTEEPGRLYSPRGHKQSDTAERLTLSLFSTEANVHPNLSSS